MEGGGEVTKTPQVLQGGSTVTVRSKKYAWGDSYVTTRSPLGQEIAAISEKNYSLKSWRAPRDRPQNRLSSLSH